jgi:hypothetical protein
MKNLINKIKTFIKVKFDKHIQPKIDEFVIRRFTILMPKALITSLYKKIAESELQISTREVHVKKGNIKYTLLIVKNRNLETVYHLGRPELTNLKELVSFVEDFGTPSDFHLEIVNRLSKSINDGRYSAKHRSKTNLTAKQKQQI